MKKSFILFMSALFVFSLSVASYAENENITNGVIYSSDLTELISLTELYSGGGEFNVPNSVTTIKDGAFFDNKSVTSIVLPDTIVLIGNDAFAESKIEFFDFSKADALEEIKACAFLGCNELKHIEIPPCVKTIGESVFKNCTQLETMRLPMIEFSDTMLYGCFQLKSVILVDSDGKTVTYYAGSSTPDEEKVYASDARIVLRKAAKLEEQKKNDLFFADINRDCIITASDARLVLRMAAGLR